MLEIAPGVYTAPRMGKAIRERVWAVLEEWFGIVGGGSIVMTWRDVERAGGQGILTLGIPPKVLHDQEGVLLVRTASPARSDEAVPGSDLIE
jgi:CRISPR-associated protein Cas2